MGRTLRSSSTESSNQSAFSSLTQPEYEPSTDLSLGLGITSSQGNIPHLSMQQIGEPMEEDGDECNNTTFYVKVYMEGIPIGRKLDLLSHDGYHDLIRTLEYMFNTPIFWAEADKVHSEVCHVLTYEDKEGDWMILGDVPWELFLSTVRRLKITRTDKF